MHFGYLTDKIVNYTFKLVALIPEDRYKDFENIDEFETFCNGHGVSISNEEIEDPKNPANIINSKLITYYY